MENRELDDAIDWLKRALALEQDVLVSNVTDEEKREVADSLERKRKLLEKLERMNLSLNGHLRNA